MLYQVREILISAINSVRSERIVFLASELGLQKVSLFGKGIVIPKVFTKVLISVVSLLALLSRHLSWKWFVVSEYSGNFIFYMMTGNLLVVQFGVNIAAAEMKHFSFFFF